MSAAGSHPDGFAAGDDVSDSCFCGGAVHAEDEAEGGGGGGGRELGREGGREREREKGK